MNSGAGYLDLPEPKRQRCYTKPTYNSAFSVYPANKPRTTEEYLEILKTAGKISTAMRERFYLTQELTK